MVRDDDEFENTNVTIGSSTVTLGSSIGNGKEGTVYPIRGSSDEVVKIFEDGRRSTKRGKVKEMVRNQPEDPVEDQLGSPSLIWPVSTVKSVSGGHFLGYAMPRLETNEFRDAQTYARNALDHSNSNANFRYMAAATLALPVALVHLNGHAMGDMHHSNILVKDGLVTLIDCDGFHISGKYRDFGGSTHFPRYDAPESRSKDDDPETVQLSDRFGLAVHIFQFLMSGQHPFVAVGDGATSGSTKKAIQGNDFPYSNPNPGWLEPPDRAPDYGALPAELKALFDAAFVDGKTQPSRRPTAKDWVNALARVSSMDTSGSDPVVPDTKNGDLGDRRNKWDRQRKQRRQQDALSGSGQSARRSNSSSTASSSTGRTADGGSYSRESENWAEEIRNDSSAGGGSSSGSTSTSTTSSRSSTNSSSSSGTSSTKNDSGSTLSSQGSDSEDSEASLLETLVGLIMIIILLWLSVKSLIFLSGFIF